jgi:hypothetical protein
MTPWAPRARADGLIETQVADDMVVYDTATDRVHCLNPSAVALWRACDGAHTPVDLAGALGAEYEVVWHGLRQLGEQGLLETPVPGPPAQHVSRREALRKIVIGGAIGFAVPTVISIIAPEPAAAASCRTLGEPCTTEAQCCKVLGVAQLCVLDLCVAPL